MSPEPSAETRRLSRAEARSLPAGADHYSAYVGPADQWDLLGAMQFRLLTTLGLREDHRLLDIGCGGLRVGRLLIPYLNAGGYCGIEPNGWLVEDAIAAEIGPEIVRRKAPRFSESATFDPAGLGGSFDFILAQSIFSHAGPDLLAEALGKLAPVLVPGGLMLFTFICTDEKRGWPLNGWPVEEGGWIYPGCTAYRPETLETAFAAAGLAGRRLPWFHPRQSWYAIAHRPEDLPDPRHDPHLGGGVLRVPVFADSLKSRA